VKNKQKNTNAINHNKIRCHFVLIHSFAYLAMELTRPIWRTAISATERSFKVTKVSWFFAIKSLMKEKVPTTI